MDFNKYFSDLPKDLDTADTTDEYKLLVLYVFNTYFGADLLQIVDLKDGLTYQRKNGSNNIDAVYINERSEEDTLEVLYSYYVGNETFNIGKVFNALDYISAYLNDVINRKYYCGDNKKAEDRVNELKDQIDNKNIIIRVITDYSPNCKEGFEIEHKIAEHYLTEKLPISAVICFGKDILQEVEQNKEPFNWVSEGKLVVDDPNNRLRYGDNSFICNISAQSLKSLWDLEGGRGLLAMNLRYYVKNATIDDKIEESITQKGDNFWYLNNGIIIVCDDYSFKGNELRMTNFSIVNGGQTTRMIGKIPFDNDFYVSCKVVKNTFENYRDKNIFVSDVASASNTQKPIKAKDIIANKVEQRNLKTLLQENGIFCEIKRGEKCDNKQYPEPWQKTKNNELAQDLYSFVYMEPGPTRNNVSKILESKDKYKKIFATHEYTFDFLKDLIILEKCYKTYKSKASKDETMSPTKQNLIKNGQFYCLATIGYILKLLYNTEYYENMRKNRNNEPMYKLQSPQLAFNHKFIRDEYTYKTFLPEAFKLFDYVFEMLIINVFNTEKENNKALSYSNWTKQNTGFNKIRNTINYSIFDSHDYMGIIPTFAKFFRQVSEEQVNQNIDSYVDTLKNHGEIKATDTKGNELNDKDTDLRNELLIFRMKKSAEMHIRETSVFTDNMLDKLVSTKPQTKDELKKIVSGNTLFFCGDEILALIQKNM